MRVSRRRHIAYYMGQAVLRYIHIPWGHELVRPRETPPVGSRAALVPERVVIVHLRHIAARVY